MSQISILLINPASPYLENDAAYPPMGLLHVAAAFEREGCKVSVLDMAVDKCSPEMLRNVSASLVGITCVTPNISSVRDIIDSLPRTIPTMVGGIHPTVLPSDTFLQTGCKFVVRGEIEKQVSLILSEIWKKNPPRIFHGGIVEAEDITKPARHLVNLHDYQPGGEDATPVYTSRGCPFSCNFCSSLPGSRYREIPLKQVMEEVHYCIDDGFNKIVFGDDNMGINRKRLLELLARLKPLNIEFRLNMDARRPDRALFEAAADAGCTDISFGIESGDVSILDAMNKQISMVSMEEAIQLTKACGMQAKAYFMVNFPGETEETVKATLDFADRTRPDKWLLSAFAPLPGSDTWKRPDKYGITWTSMDWNDYYLVGKGGSFQPCFETNYLTKKKQIELHEMMWNGLKKVLG